MTVWAFSPRTHLIALGVLVALATLVPDGAIGGGVAEQDVQQWHGGYADTRDPGTSVVDAKRPWAKLWSRAYGPDRGGDPPDFDATHQIGVGIFLGRRPTGGYSIRISFMGPRDGRFVIEFEEASPPPESITTQAVTSPWLILLIERPALPVSVERRSAP